MHTVTLDPARPRDDLVDSINFRLLFHAVCFFGWYIHTVVCERGAPFVTPWVDDLDFLTFVYDTKSFRVLHVLMYGHNILCGILGLE